MRCPFCQAEDTKVSDSRAVAEGNTVKRRRYCEACHERFTTHEVVELSMPRIVKRDQSRQVFNEQKLRQGVLLALEKRPVGSEQIERAISTILRKIRSQTEKEIASDQVGEFVMDELKGLDQVAYVRFASVYRRFENIEEFQREIEKMRKS